MTEEKKLSNEETKEIETDTAFYERVVELELLERLCSEGQEHNKHEKNSETRNREEMQTALKMKKATTPAATKPPE
jgi:hypothetical protein